MAVRIRTLSRVTLVLASVVLLGGCATSGGGTEGSTDVSDIRVKEGADTMAETNVKLGVAYMQNRQYDLALAKLRKAVKQDPDLPTGHYAIALLYERLGDTDEAEVHYRRAIALQPSYSEAQNAYGVYLCKRDKYAEAEEHFQAALKNPLYRGKDIVLMNAGVCARSAGQMAKAENYLRQSLQLNPQRARTLYYMAQVNYDNGEYLQARGYMQRYEAVSRHSPQSLWLGIQLERQLGDKDAVASYALLLKSKYPDSDEARMLRESEGR